MYVQCMYIPTNGTTNNFPFNLSLTAVHTYIHRLETAIWGSAQAVWGCDYGRIYVSIYDE